MTKEQTSAVPEELYNLTQLAEVTLAAGRLSTTNIAEIKDYINAKKHIDDDDADVDADDVAMPSAETAVAKAAVKREVASSPECADMWAPSGALKAAEFHNGSRNSASHTGSGSNNPMFYSSSDDDSNYYSHKVFDRRKLRRSTISDNSRYDEHSCSSVPSCSGDEHCHGAASTGSCSNTGTTNNSDTGSAGSSLGLLDDEHICPECGKKYSTSSNLARHRQTHRSLMDKKARRCPYCAKVYVSMPAFSMHVRTHNQGCECQYCGKCFSRPWLLQGHIRTHTGEKPFKCNVCNKAFADKSNLRAHIQTHSNTKPHTCARCGKAFALKSYLYKHEESSCMKNHPRPEREGRASVRAATPAPTPVSGKSKAPVTISTDSAKSTLATKLLQKERDRRQAALTPYTHAPATTTPSRVSQPATQLIRNSLAARNLQIFAVTTTAEAATPAAANSQQQTEKSYTMITSPMSQEDYERFKRISVIQPTALLQSDATYADSANNCGHTVATLTPTSYYNSSSTDIHTQDQPVDFSPKNNFTHSTKTSPFELTGNYAIVA